MLIAITLAVLWIWSPSIGEFFTVPSWVSASVPAENTPGCYLETNATRRVVESSNHALGAVYAPFAAFCERAYFYSAGARNQWSIAEYGDLADMRRFRFGLPTNSVPAFVYSPDTNRAIITRRFVEWANLHALAGALTSGGGLQSKLSVVRPSWTAPAFTAWASSGFDGFGSATLPGFAWTASMPSAIATTSEWARVGMTFDRCAAKRLGEVIDWRGSDRETLAYKMWNCCNFGEWPTNEVPRYADIGVTATDIVTNMFGGGIGGLTNATRRLYKDRLAAADKCLGALDRTYCLATATVQHDGGSYSTNITLAASAVTVSLDWQHMKTVGLEGRASGWTVDGGSAHDVRAGSNRDGEAVVSMTAATDSGTIIQRLDVTPHQMWYSAAQFGGQIGVTNRIWIASTDARIVGSDVLARVNVIVEGAGEFEIADTFAAPTSATVHRYASAARSYQWMMATNEVLEVRPAQDGGHIRNGSAFALAAWQTAAGTALDPLTSAEPPTGPIVSASRTVMRGGFTNSTYTAAAGARIAAGNLAATFTAIARGDFSAAVGAMPDAATVIAPLALADVTPALEDVELNELNIGLECRVLQYADGGTNVDVVALLEWASPTPPHEPEFLGLLLANGHIVKPALPFVLALVSVRGDSENAVGQEFARRKYGHNDAVRHAIGTRTDWNWGSLRNGQ